MTYNEAIDYIYSFIDYETRRNVKYDQANYNLDRTLNLYKKLGCKKTYKIIHIAGTKGKGSVSFTTGNILKNLGFKVGVFTSPHLLDIRERFQVDFKPISEHEFIAITTDIKKEIDKMDDKDIPTTFEIFTIFALKYFEKSAVDYGVIEVGMGGRLDSTNIVNPDICAITSISFDHMNKLGNTLKEISYEKAGIIKDNIPVICADGVDEIKSSITDVAKERNIKPDFFQDKFSGDIIKLELNKNVLKYSSDKNSFEITHKLNGIFQSENIGISIRIIETLLELDDNKIDKIKKSFTTHQILGRMNIIKLEPPTFLDGAHNKDSINKLCLSIKEYTNTNKFIFLFAPIMDKDIAGMLEVIKDYAERLIISIPETHKSTDLEYISNICDKLGISYEKNITFKDALTRFDEVVENKKIVGVITGSLYTVSSYLNIKGTNFSFS